jgi:two-component system phosphate regulon response regulator PhoB
MKHHESFGDDEPDAIDILICEDDPFILESIEHIVGMEGFAFRSTESGKEALEMARRLRPKVILLDLMLPDMSGLDVCRDLKARLDTRDMKVLILTARGQDADIEAGLAAGADEYITKPYSPRALLGKLHAILDG